MSLNGEDLFKSVLFGSGGGGESSGGSGVLLINASCDYDGTNDTFTNATKDKTYAEIKAAYDSGAFITLRMEYLSIPSGRFSVQYSNIIWGSMEGMGIFFIIDNNNVLANKIYINEDDTFFVVKD